MAQVRVLVVEDDAGLADALGQTLRADGWVVRHASTGKAALDQLDDKIDLILLDMGLPDHDGLWVCQKVRATSPVPIIAVTARRNESSVVGALRAGIDDYMTKPYSLAVLLARMDAVLRRASGRAMPPDRPDLGFTHDHTSRQLRLADGSTTTLTTKESELLAALARNPGQTATRAALMEEVWDTTWVGASRTLDVHVASLRAKLGDAPQIETVWGTGYRLRVPPMNARADET